VFGKLSLERKRGEGGSFVCWDWREKKGPFLTPKGEVVVTKTPEKGGIPGLFELLWGGGRRDPEMGKEKRKKDGCDPWQGKKRVTWKKRKK